MKRSEADWIKAAYNAYRDQLVAELSRHPGGTLDDLDLALVVQFMNRLKVAGRRGARIAHFEENYRVGLDKIIWINGAGNILLWIRDRKFRPKMHEIEAEAERLGMIDLPKDQTGEEAAQRRLVSAPDEYKQLAAKAGDGLLGLPPAEMPTETPSWLDRFPTLENQAMDRIMMNCLLHLSEGKAHATIDTILRDRAAAVRRRQDQAAIEDKRQEIRMRRIVGDDATSTMLRLYGLRRAMQ